MTARPLSSRTLLSMLGCALRRRRPDSAPSCALKFPVRPATLRRSRAVLRLP